MRVLHLTRDFPPRDNGGLSTAVGHMVAASREAGIECAVISFDAWRPRSSPAAAEPGGADEPWGAQEGVLRIRSPSQDDEVLAFARRFVPDAVHVHDALLWPYASRFGVPSVYSLHVAHTILSRLRGLERPTRSEQAEAIAMANATRLTVPSLTLARDLGLENRAVVVPPHRLEPVDGASERSGVLFVGRFADYKGVGELFEAIGEVAAAFPGAHFDIVGGLRDNPRAEARWRARFHRGASPAAAAATRFVGWLDRAAVAPHYRAASILVAPSWYETFGLAVIEGMCHGLAVVASNAGGLSELVAHGETGLLVPPRDPGALAAALLELLREPDLARAMGERGRAAARGRAAPDATLMHQLYDGLGSGCTRQPAQ